MCIRDSVYAAGEEWTARGSGVAILERGTSVRVTGNDGMVLIVEPALPISDSQEGTV
jgi:membrane protein implicated in regulation of membrane protease activity